MLAKLLHFSFSDIWCQPSYSISVSVIYDVSQVTPFQFQWYMMSAKLLHFSFSDIWCQPSYSIIVSVIYVVSQVTPFQFQWVNRLGIMWHGIRECKCSHVIRKCQTTRACLEQEEGQLYVTESTNVVNYV